MSGRDEVRQFTAGMLLAPKDPAKYARRMSQHLALFRVNDVVVVLAEVIQMIAAKVVTDVEIRPNASISTGQLQ